MMLPLNAKKIQMKDDRDNLDDADHEIKEHSGSESRDDYVETCKVDLVTPLTRILGVMIVVCSRLM